MNTNKLWSCSWAAIVLMASPARAADSLESAMKEVAASLGPSLSESGLKKLAVVEFTDLNGYRSALGPFLAEELTTQLFEAKPGAFDFVERQQLVKVLEEQKLTSSSLFEAGSIANVGKVLGIQAIVTGSIADLGEEIKVNTRVISVESARIVAAASARFPKTGPAMTLLRQSGGSVALGGPAARTTQSSDVYFRNDFLQITVESISIKGSQINLTLVLENIATFDLTLGLQCLNTIITISNGGTYRCRSLNGIGDGYYNDWTVFSAQSRTIIALSFGSGGTIGGFSVGGDEPPTGYYSFSAKFRRKIRDELIYFSAGLSGIHLEAGRRTD